MKNNLIPINYLNGRGAQINPSNRFDNIQYDSDPLQYVEGADELRRTEYLEIQSRKIINKVTSPDLHMDYSMNPYQGCEHGCIYCYARNTHNYWGYSAGLDFEQKILVKPDAPQLLEARIRKKNWKASPIMLSGNTDCYQPAEAEYGLTRKMLEILLRYRHPVGIITKSSLILRDIDLLQQLAELQLVKVAISLTSLDETLQRRLEPRAASVLKRLKTIETLTAAGIPVNVMMAPVIPGLTEHEILPLAEKVAEKGAYNIAFTLVRLNGDVAEIFEDWIRKVLPDRADRVLNRIRDIHGGQLNDSRFGTRMSGEGKIAEVIHKQFRLARTRYFEGRSAPAYNLSLHDHFKSPQMSLF